MNLRAVLVSGLAVCSLSLVACKGETTFKDNPATLSKLESLTAQAAQKDQLIKDYTARVVSLEMGGGSGAPVELLITFVDDILKVGPGAGSGRAPIDDAAAAAMSKTFIDVVQKSRGAIQKCYQSALKKNTAMQARTVTIKISASFAASGDFQKTSFSPALDAAFDTCLRGVAGKWKLPASSHPVTFQAPVSLTPS